MINKKGALELSIGTIVVIVIGMSMLVLGLVLVRTIFTGSTESVETLNDGVMNEIVSLFDDESGNLLIKLGSANVARVKPGKRFNVAIGAQHPAGEAVELGTVLYRVQLDSQSSNNCLQKLGQRKAEELFVTPLDSWNNFDGFRSSNSFATIEVDVPKGTETCTQKVNVDVRLDESQSPFEGDFFVLEVAKEGIF